MLPIDHLTQYVTLTNVLIGLVLLPVSFHVALLVYGKLVPNHPKGTRKLVRPETTLPIFEDTLDVLLRGVGDIHDRVAFGCQACKGEPILIRVWGRPDMTILSTPQAIEDVFKNDFSCFPKGSDQCGNLRDLLGNGIFAVDHAKWVHQRKTASHLFTMRALRDSMTSTVQSHALILHQILYRASANRESIDLFRLFNRFTMEAFAEIGFGIHMGCLDSEKEHPFQTAFDGAQRALVMRFVLPSWLWKAMRWLNIGPEALLKRSLKVIDETVLDIIAKSLEKRAQTPSQSNDTTSSSNKDIVSLFLDNITQAPDLAGKEFDPQYLRDIVVNFLIAGRDTTAQALSWFFYRLSDHPEIAQKIRAELTEHLPDLMNGKIATPSMEQVERLVYLEAALKETLRLHPSVPFSTKHVMHDVVLSDGTFVRANSIVGLPFYAMGRMTEVWGEDAEEFKPERWIDPTTGKIIPVSAYKFVAFNCGPRMCLGMNLAMLEMKLIVSSVLSKFVVELVPGQNVTYDFSLTLPVKGKLMANITQIKS